MARGRPSKKQVILDAARKLFAESGFQGTSIDLVVLTAGVSKPTVYNNFPTKQALLLALMEQLLDESASQRREILHDDSRPLVSGLIDLFKVIASSTEYLAVYRIFYGERHKLDDETYQLFRQFDQSLQDDCRNWLLVKGVALHDERMLAVIAVCREGILIPALSGESVVPEVTVKAALSQFL